jgi:hypothetical protein
MDLLACVMWIIGRLVILDFADCCSRSRQATTDVTIRKREIFTVGTLSLASCLPFEIIKRESN